MRAYKCDICGKYFVHDVNVFRDKNIRYFNIVTFHIGGRYFDDNISLDACPKCMMKLMHQAKIDNMVYSFDAKQEKFIEKESNE